MNFFAYYFATIFKDFFTHLGSRDFTGISTDSRTIKEGEIFTALIGQNYNGADFIKQAIDKGASGIICRKEDLPQTPLDPSISLMLTDDPLDLYQQIAFEYLKMKKTTLVIAITGSAGKTSIKEWLYQVLSQQFTVYKSQGNINNLIGVPQSIFEIQKENIAILELGTGKVGDIKKLASLIYPAVGVITSIGAAHLEFFGSIEAIAKEKADLIDYADRTFVPYNIFRKEEYFDLAYDVDPKDIFDSVLDNGLDGYEVTYKGHTFNFPFFGEHNIQSLAIVLQIATLSGMTPERIAQTVFEPLPSYRNKKLTIQNTTVLLDCYNANPLSMEKSIRSLEALDKKITLVLGDMLELGSSAPEYHTQLGTMLNDLKHIQSVYFVGHLMKNAYDSYNGTKHYEESLEQMKDPLKSLDMKKDQVLFVKGSRGMALENILEYLG